MYPVDFQEQFENHMLFYISESILLYLLPLLFKSTYDGELIISNKDHVVDKRKIYADKPLS